MKKTPVSEPVVDIFQTQNTPISPMELYTRETGIQVPVYPIKEQIGLVPAPPVPPPYVKTAMIFVTPAMAAWILKSHHGLNRRISKQRIKTLKNSILSDKFPFVGDPIRFCLFPDGRIELVDGQHRLQAIVEATVGMWMNVCYYLKPEDRLFIDIGRNRSSADNLIFTYGVHRAKELCAWVRLLSEAVLKEGKIVTPDAIYALLCDHQDTFNWALAKFTRKTPWRDPPCAVPAAPIVAFLWAYPTDPEKVNALADMFITGANLSETHPILIARKKAQGLKPEHGTARFQQVAAVLKGIAMALRGETCKRIIIGDSYSQDMEPFRAAWDAEALREPTSADKVPNSFALLGFNAEGKKEDED